MLVRVTATLVTAAAYIAGAVLVALMLLTAADVAGRAILNEPITGVFDLTHFAVLTMAFLGLGYCGLLDEHISIEMLYQKMSRPVRQMLDRLSNLIGAVLFGLMAWRAVVQADLVGTIGEASQLLNIPFYPFYWLLALGAALFAIVMLLRIFVPAQDAEKTP